MRPPTVLPAARSGDTRLRRAAGPTIAGWAAGIVGTGLVVWSPDVLFGYHSPSAHLVLDSVDACVALLVAYLLHGRFVRRRQWQDLLLAQGLVLLVIAGIGLAWTVEASGLGPAGTLDVWLPLALRLLGAALVAAAALVGPRRDAPFSSELWVVGVPLVLATATFSALWAVRSSLPVALDRPGALAETPQAILTGHPLLLAGQGVAALCFFVASLVFTAQAAEHEDSLLRWLGPACALAAFARVNYVLFPSLYTDWLYAGDVFRTGFYLFLLVGAGREIREYWTAASRAAVLEDRRRLARELHDGVVQELSLIRMESHALPQEHPSRNRIMAASDRGLDEARAAVHALGHDEDEALGSTLHRTARELARRYRVELEVDVDDSVDADGAQRHAILRITREAVSNAVRHGHAGRLCLRLSRDGDRRRLVVRDDGDGFDVLRATGAPAGYGLISMRDRARGLPGSLEIDSEPGGGSTVTVTW
ncbi:sensor histidine kinase [Kocuria turfanensis]|uniref:Histidine kinase domain-containing protein n=1 Tax=Kocuria turfanensis TaxID=388357 RepID=A0A512IF26_9MICC|nr:sensor histidine kinase [Kocuria turfanensis]GEO96311.1 hypothetical protein KTU01_24340 [Kocuria turfanensis]